MNQKPNTMQSDLALAANADQVEDLVEVVLQSRSHIEYRKVEIKKGFKSTCSRKGKRMSGIICGRIEAGKPISLFIKTFWQYPKVVSSNVLKVYKKGEKTFIETVSSIYEVLSYKEPAILN